MRAGRRPLPAPVRIVAFGGGTGLSTLLKGLVALPRVEVSAVVAVTDDGGSSGRLREELGAPAVGDARACLSAVARHEEWARLFEHRFRRIGPLRDHAVGNLLLAASWERTGRLSTSLAELSRLVGARARLLPATDAVPVLVARLADGRVLRGESLLARVAGPVERVSLSPPIVAPAPGVIEAVAEADLVVLGPGSLFTSVLASTLAAGVSRALSMSGALKVFVQNLTTQKGETDEMGAVDHLRAVRRHLGARSVDAVLCHQWNGQPPQGAVVADLRALEALGVRAVPARLATDQGRGRLHDPVRLARVLCQLALQHRAERERQAPPDERLAGP